VALRVVLTDDGSTDGTAQAAREVWPDVHLVRGDGSLFWAKSMALAASAAHDFDFLLWLNDDVVLDSGALSRLLGTYRSLVKSQKAPLVVGALRDPHTGTVTYSGVAHDSSLRPMRFSRVVPAGIPVQADTMNGNLVLVPRKVVERVGHLDGAFSHGMADFDYGLRARSAGCEVWVAPRTLGTCARNSSVGEWTDPALSVAMRWRMMRSPKGLPPGSWLRFTRRHAGPMWLLHWLSPYVHFLVGAVSAGALGNKGRTTINTGDTYEA
jgi:GT2 family glycosyltransferase